MGEEKDYLPSTCLLLKWPPQPVFRQVSAGRQELYQGLPMLVDEVQVLVSSLRLCVSRKLEARWEAEGGPCPGTVMCSKGQPNLLPAGLPFSRDVAMRSDTGFSQVTLDVLGVCIGRSKDGCRDIRRWLQSVGGTDCGCPQWLEPFPPSVFEGKPGLREQEQERGNGPKRTHW